MNKNDDVIKALTARYLTTRNQTVMLCQPLNIEDYTIQSHVDVSPPKWHLAHTSWFFETFILIPRLPDYLPFDPLFHYIFNSYYHGIGKPFPRHQRGFLARPSVQTVYDYRTAIDRAIINLLQKTSVAELPELTTLISLGLQHEQQHQELLLMDIKYNLSIDPHLPNYRTSQAEQQATTSTDDNEFIAVAGGNINIGHNQTGFCFDTELPQHSIFLKPYLISQRLVNNREYLDFIADGGYQTPQWWLADGWECVEKNQWLAPLYWQKQKHEWYIFTLSGLQLLNPEEPVAHISYFEAEAYARWCGKRLPLESEWEHFVTTQGLTPAEGNFMENGLYQPRQVLKNNKSPVQFYGDLWEWTGSSYHPYPGFVPLNGALGEYNGKFMNNQMVLRGGSCVTPLTHIRASYRNFFQPDKRWQFSGIRLAANN